MESLALSTSTETTNSATSNEPDQSQKLQRALTDLINATLLFVTAKSIEESTFLDDAPREVNSVESVVPRSSYLEDSSSAVLISDPTS